MLLYKGYYLFGIAFSVFVRPYIDHRILVLNILGKVLVCSLNILPCTKHILSTALFTGASTRPFTMLDNNVPLVIPAHTLFLVFFAHCKKPLIVKLSPNVTDIASIAQAAEAEGADAVSMINTLTGMKIDINTRRPIIHNNTGGLSGAAVFPVAVRMVWQVSNAVKIPIIGMGGITTWEDAVEMLIAGATALQIGTVLFSDPYAPIKIAEGVNKFLDDNNISSVTELTGTVRPW